MITIELNDTKMSRQLARLVKKNAHSNNYEETHIEVRFKDDGSITAETVCINEYGAVYGNKDATIIKRSDLPYFLAVKLNVL